MPVFLVVPGAVLKRVGEIGNLVTWISRILQERVSEQEELALSLLRRLG